MTEQVEAHVSVEELHDQLDALWEKHLTLLDSYHQAQQQLARHLSLAFFDLAQATFKSKTRVRYGQEFYDDRMQATRRFEASTDNDDLPRLALKVKGAVPPSDTKSSKEDSTRLTKQSLQHEANEDRQDEANEDKRDEASEDKQDEASQDKQETSKQQQATPPSTPPRHTQEKPSEQQDAHENNKDKSQKKPRDPLHWYGILVPSSLRSSQRSFVSAIESPVIEAANSAQALRHVALEIRKLRKHIKKAERRVV